MGHAAERTAEQCGLSRADLDAFALESQRRAVAAQAAGAFEAEIVPVPVAGKGKGDAGTVALAADEGPRGDSTAEGLARLAPAFRPDGIVTAGNSSTLSDGAAMVVVASEEEAGRLGATPIARILATAVSGLDPRDLFLAPIGAVRTALARAGLGPDAIDLYEINEAFASQLLGCVRGLEIDPARVNVHGGAIALGHPIGASGARVLVTLLHALERRQERLGTGGALPRGGQRRGHDRRAGRLELGTLGEAVTIRTSGRTGSVASRTCTRTSRRSRWPSRRMGQPGGARYPAPRRRIGLSASAIRNASCGFEGRRTL